MTISEHLAGFALSIDAAQASPEVMAIAKSHFIDGLACMFLGTKSASVQTLLPLAKEYRSACDCIFPVQSPVGLDDIHCAMLSVMSAHSNDFDDMSATLNGHPSALLVPLIFTLAQKQGSSGRHMLTAYIAGVEVDSILGTALRDHGYRKGINTSSFIGLFGAVTAAGIMMGFDRTALSYALCIAANEASGLKANFGTLSKDFSLGMTAAKAIMVARAAGVGMDASKDAFEGPFGFFTSFCGKADVELLHHLINTHESDFLAPGLVTKPYPSCRGNHSGIDCITKLVSEFGFGVDDVEKVICSCDQASFDTDRYEYPNNPREAKFSLAFCIARVISCGRVSIDDFIGDEITDKTALEFIKKVEIRCVPSLFSESRFGTQVEVRLKDGRILNEKECYAKGDPLFPMTADEEAAKLYSCLEKALPHNKLGSVIKLLNDIENLENAKRLIDILYSKEI